MSAMLVLTLVVKAAAFGDGKAIPREYTCQGADRSPEILLENVPPAAQSWALVVDDPDAPGGTFVHWVIWNLPGKLHALPAGAPPEVLDLPDGSRQGKNDFGKVGWGGPCPPPGKVHHYRFHAFALDGKLALPERASATDLERAVRGHVLAEGTLTGTYRR
jgi:Raf kinase inhibitor-like YbhB/YbcL family protein